MDADFELQHIKRVARRAWRQHPEIREEYRHDFEFYLQHRARRAGLHSRDEIRGGYAGVE